MLIKVFDSEWFEPTGIRLERYRCLEMGTLIILNTQYVKDLNSYSSPHPHYMEKIVAIGIDDKTPDEVAAEINKQLTEV